MNEMNVTENAAARGELPRRAGALLDEGRSLLLAATDAGAASAAARALLDEARSRGQKCACISLQDVTYEETFLHRVVNAFFGSGVARETKETLARLLDLFLSRLENEGGPGSPVAAGAGDEPYRVLAGSFVHDEPGLVVLDGPTLFLGALYKETKNKDRVARLLAWLKELRTTPGTQVRWVLADAAGLRDFAASLGLSALVDDLEVLSVG